MPYILDRQTSEDVQTWVFQLAAVKHYNRGLEGIRLRPEMVPPSLQEACHYAPIQLREIVCPSGETEGVFLEVQTKAPMHEEAIGSNVWLFPLITSEVLKKALEILAI